MPNPLSQEPEPAAERSLAVAATNKIRDNILDLTLQPGMQLDETILRESLGISRTPAREALNRLITEGLVETRRNRGFFVRSLDLGETAHFFNAYMIAERSAAFFCRFDHAGFVAELEEIQADHEAAVTEDRFLDVTQHNAAFHVRIAQATENPYLIDFSGRLHNQSRRLVYFVYHQEANDRGYLDGQQSRIVKEHYGILAAIRTEDRARLLNLIMAHAERFQMRIKRLIGGRRREDYELVVDGRLMRDR
jgi:DNA-binding GntR family transcriptional regulator